MYQALARKWRPQTFEEIIGQEIIVTCLKNALNTNQIHHAYLFSGPRGTGKTSLARIFAKCLNCLPNITATPCRKCPNCQAFEQGSAVDLLEIDAASKTKVEETRELLADIRYPPAQSRFKIYLIDEVHMLSTHSFNALLKTLEEPPDHVKFLLATTELEKIPLTVLSRCLNFNLKLVNLPHIQNYLMQLLKKENISFERKALALLAQSATGSIRDALSLLEQAINYGELTYNSVLQMLGWVDHHTITQLLDALLTEDRTKVLELAQQIYQKGYDLNKVLDLLLEKLYLLALEQLEYVPAGSTNAKLTSPDRVQLLYQIGLTGKRDLSLAPNPKIGFNMTLLRMLHFQKIIPIEPLILTDQPELSVNKQSPDINSEDDLLALNLAILTNPECTGINRTLVENSIFEKIGNDLVCKIEKAFFPLLNPRYQNNIESYIKKIDPTINKVRFSSDSLSFSLATRNQQQVEKLKQEKSQHLAKNRDLQLFLSTLGGKIIEMEN